MQIIGRLDLPTAKTGNQLWLTFVAGEGGGVVSSPAVANGLVYVGIYGWSVNPCVEWYIVDDSYNKMPVNPGSTTNKGTAMIDGGTYTLYTRPTSGTGGSRTSSHAGSGS